MANLLGEGTLDRLPVSPDVASDVTIGAGQLVLFIVLKPLTDSLALPSTDVSLNPWPLPYDRDRYALLVEL
ncbi:MAG TPA: hypothetical protein VLG37_00365 [Candidatus Saccharimonadales bacterium]|nr:hypothetical protein [Candidatus Saccharimonadales bacterium]